ncbi:MAG: 2-dehydropantoate 2-reductase [Succinivibrionaceae bacterium]|nr:2-dehydropantoate 2-reductase [Succinivibrionaceae bacterium]
MAKIAAVLGLGAVGSAIAAKLIENGWDVRSADTRENPEREFDFIDGSTRKHYAIPALGDPKKADILIITLKAFATGKAVRPLRNRFRPSMPVMLLENGMGQDAAVMDVFCVNPFYLGVTALGAVKDGNTVTLNADGKAVYGPRSVNAGGIGKIKDLPDSVFCFEENPVPAVLRKLAANTVINPLTAVLDEKNGIILEKAELVRRLTDEISRVLAPLGLGETPDSLYKAVMGIAEKTRENSSSMREDVRHGRPTENDFILGFVIKTAERFGMDVPELKRLEAEFLRKAGNAA